MRAADPRRLATACVSLEKTIATTVVCSLFFTARVTFFHCTLLCFFFPFAALWIKGMCLVPARKATTDLLCTLTAVGATGL